MYYAARSTVIDGADKTRLVYLPVGADWYDFWTAKRYSGGQTICADAALNTMPLYVRSGAIVPMGPDIQFAGEQVNAVLELYIYPGQNGKFTLYDDEGDNFNYEQGAFSMILLSWDDSARRLTVHTRLGGYPDMPTSREFRLIVADNDTYTGISEARTLFYDGGEVTIDL
jgi:alpha-D-xyloside xylohydrolase